MPNVFLDFETRSELNVQDVGSSVYARHPSTGIMCMAVSHKQYSTGESLVQLAMDDNGWVKNHRAVIIECINDPETLFHAHNAAFEMAIWREIMVRKYGMPDIPTHRWRCTAAKAAAMALPRKLETLGAALKLPVQKDSAGHKVMLKLTKPRKLKGQGLVFWRYADTPQDFESLYSYCMTDVQTEVAADTLIPDLNRREQQVWFLDQEINFRGVAVDVEAVQQTIRFIEATKEKLSEEFKALTRGYVTSPAQVAAFREWLAVNGCVLPDLKAGTVDKALKLEQPKHVKRALEIRRDLSKTSTAKYPKIMERLDRTDNRLRDLFLYAAAITRRWGGRGVQVHNLPRGIQHPDKSMVSSDTAVIFIKMGDFEFFCSLYTDLMGVYSTCIRGMLVARPGYELYVSDLSGIEARVLPWLSGHEASLQVFIRNEDPYCVEAGNIFSRKVVKSDKYERGVGKVAVLGLGFGGGIGAFGTMAETYFVDIRPAYAVLWPTATTDERERAKKAYAAYLKRGEKKEDFIPLDEESALAADIIKQRWRKANKLIQTYWYDLENAAIQAVLTGEKQTVGGDFYDDYGNLLGYRPPVTYGMMGEHLLCRLPSGNCITYPFAKVSQKETDWGDIKATLSYKTQNEKNYQYDRTFTYGGKLCENVVQGVARDLLAAALVRQDAAGFYLVMHCHDEAVAEMPVGLNRLEEFNTLMATNPEWAAGLPLKAEAWKGDRYRKG